MSLEDSKNRFVPDDILRLASRNPTVNAILMEWRLGWISWEQCIIEMVITLENQNRALIEKELERLRNEPIRRTWIK